MGERRIQWIQFFYSGEATTTQKKPSPSGGESRLDGLDIDDVNVVVAAVAADFYLCGRRGYNKGGFQIA